MNEIYLRSLSGQSYRIEGEMRLGRDETCQVNINDGRISRLHATLTVKEGFLYIRDEGSSNGTYINGIRTNKPILLQTGDQIQVGNTKLKVEYVPIQDPAEPFEKTEVVAAMANLSAITHHPSPSLSQDPHASPSPQQFAFTLPPLRENELIKTLTNYPIPFIKNKLGKPFYFLKKGQLLPLSILIVAILIGSVVLILLPFLGTEKSTEQSGGDPQGKETFIIGMGGGEIKSASGVNITIPPKALYEKLTFDVSQELTVPQMTTPLTALEKAYRIQTSKALLSRVPIEINLPLAEDAIQKDTFLSVFRSQDRTWQYLGGTVAGQKLRFFTEELGVFQIGVLPSDKRYNTFVTVSFVNQGDVQVSVRPWQWWLPPESALTDMVDVKQLITYTQNDSFAYLALPYGVFSSWCLAWYNEKSQEIHYQVLNRELSLTLYSCQWQDYLQGKCKLETVALKVNTRDEGSNIGCSK